MKSLVMQGSAPPSTVGLDTAACFDLTYTGSAAPAIDRFFENHEAINKIATAQALADHPVVGGLALLGSVSAVESYFREVLRRTILLDKRARLQSHQQKLTYGAATIHNAEMLPEALLEDYSFASGANVTTAFKELLDVGGQPPTEIKTALTDFDKLCQFRHCVVHRFGKLGTRNALKLGLDAHGKCVEKPLALAYGQLQDTFLISYNTVKACNTYLFTQLMNRTAAQNEWTWDYRKDRKRFTVYWDLFASKTQPPTKPASAREAYDSLRASVTNKP